MQITGYLSEFSLPELFQFLERGNKSGRLILQSTTSHILGKKPVFLIWFKQGEIVAAADRADGQGLLSLIHSRGWISSRAAARLMEVCASERALGICLKSQGLLEAEQLKLLFRIQVLKQVCSLFEVPDARFLFEHQVNPPSSELTGLKSSPTEVTLAGLRALRNWTILSEKLPETTSGIIYKTDSKPKFRLNQLEWQIWEFAEGNVPICDIAKQLNLPVEKIRQAAFRLIVTGYLEEVPLIQANFSDEPEMTISFLEDAPAQAPISQSFLKNLVGFLKSQT